MVINSRERWTLASFGALAALVIVWRYVQMPLIDKLDTTRSGLEKANADLQHARVALKQEGDQVQRKAHVADLQQQLASLIPGKESARYLIYNLDQAQQGSGARIHTLKMGDPVKNGDLLEVPVTLDVTGMFASHVMFDQALEHMPVFTATHGFTLTGNDAKVDPGKGPLTAVGDIKGNYTIHLFFQPGVAGPDSLLPFAVPAGRIDPFAFAGLADFMTELQGAFPGGGTSTPPAQLG